MAGLVEELGTQTCQPPISNMTNVSNSIVLSDLIAPEPQQDHSESPSDPVSSSNAVAVLPREAAVAISPRPISAELERVPNGTIRPGPRLDRIPTLAIRAAKTITRRFVEPADLRELSASIKSNGLAQPLLVRVDPTQPGTFELFAGYRRWRAALMAEVAYVPAIVFQGLSDAVTIELGLLENLHRRELTVIEEAEAFQLLIDKFGRTHQQIALLTCRSRSQITNVLRLMTLPDEVKEIMHKRRITYGHARALLGAVDPVALARRVIAERLTVRETERAAAGIPVAPLTAAHVAARRVIALPMRNKPEKSSAHDDTISPLEVGMLQAELTGEAGTQVEISIKPEDAAMLIQVRSMTDVASIVQVLREALGLLRKSRGSSSVVAISHAPS
jgi:ParB family transcriptional regulator, chromosome partitioning protein